MTEEELHAKARQWYREHVWHSGEPAWENADWKTREICYASVR